MRIQILLPDRLENPRGGMGEQMNQLIKHSNDIDWNIISFHEEKKTEYSIPIEYLQPPTVDISTSSSTLLSQLSIFYTAIKEEKPDVIHAFDWSTFYAGIYLAKYWNVPLVITIQLSINRLLEDEVYSRIPDANVSCACEYQGLIEANAIIHVSNNYAKYFPFKYKSCIIPNGIDLEQYKTFEKVDLPGNNKFKLVYIGRIDTMKGITTIMNSKIPSDVDLIFIAGKDASQDDLYYLFQDWVKQQKNVYHVGPKYGQEKINYLYSADAQIVPSLHEPFGIVGLEALASKSVLISSFAGGMSDYLTDDIAVRCDSRDSNSLVAAINQVKNMSEQERQSRIEKGLEVCKVYNWKDSADKLKQVYKIVSGK